MQLYLKQDFFTLHRHMELVNEQDEVIYTAKTKMISLHDSTEVFNKEGTQISSISRKLITLHEVHDVQMADGRSFSMSTKLFSIDHERIHLDETNMNIVGNFIRHDFQIVDDQGNVLADIVRKFITMHNAFLIDIHDDSQADLIVTILITLQHIMVDRQAARSGAGSSSN